MNPTTLLVHQSVWALLASVLLEWAKNAKWFPLLTANTARLNRFAGVAVSGFAAFGVHFAFDHTVGSLTITGLTLAGILAGGKEWIRTFLTQELVYQNFVRGKIGATAPPDTPPAATSAPAAPIVPLPGVTPAAQH